MNENEEQKEQKEETKRERLTYLELYQCSDSGQPITKLDIGTAKLYTASEFNAYMSDVKNAKALIAQCDNASPRIVAMRHVCEARPRISESVIL